MLAPENHSDLKFLIQKANLGPNRFTGLEGRDRIAQNHPLLRPQADNSDPSARNTYLTYRSQEMRM
mgnify:CR=1 FL=1